MNGLPRNPIPVSGSDGEDQIVMSDNAGDRCRYRDSVVCGDIQVILKSISDKRRNLSLQNSESSISSVPFSDGSKSSMVVEHEEESEDHAFGPKRDSMSFMDGYLQSKQSKDSSSICLC